MEIAHLIFCLGDAPLTNTQLDIHIMAVLKSVIESGVAPEDWLNRTWQGIRVHSACKNKMLELTEKPKPTNGRVSSDPDDLPD